MKYEMFNEKRERESELGLSLNIISIIKVVKVYYFDSKSFQSVKKDWCIYSTLRFWVWFQGTVI